MCSEKGREERGDEEERGQEGMGGGEEVAELC